MCGDDPARLAPDPAVARVGVVPVASASAVSRRTAGSDMTTEPGPRHSPHDDAAGLHEQGAMHSVAGS